MKPASLLCLFWDAHLPALIHYLAQRPCTVLTLSSNEALLQAEAVLRDTGSQLVLLDGLLDQELLARCEREAGQRYEGWARLAQQPAWQEACAQYGLSAATVAAQIEARMAAQLYDELVLTHGLDRAAERYRIELTAVSEDWTLLPRTLAEWSRARGIPSLHVAHGLPLATPYTVHAHLSADVYAIHGQRAFEACLDAGVPADKLRLTGNPAWDSYARVAGRRDEWLLELRHKHGLRPAPTVVFATTWVAKLSAFDALDRFDTSVRAFMLVIRALRDTGRDWNFVIKDRPANLQDGRQRVARLAAEEGVPFEALVYATDAAMPWVVCADAIVAMDSNILIEAMHVGTPAINLLNDHGLLMGPSFDAESGILEVAAEDLPATLTQTVEDDRLRAELAERMAARVAHYNLGADGLAAQRVAALMLEMAAPATAACGPERLHQEAPKQYVWQSLGAGAGERQADEHYPDIPRREVVALFARAPRRVLDVGCATGATGAHIKTLYPEAWVAGIELAHQAAEIARGRLDLVIEGRIEDVDLAAHGIAPHSLDTVILADVLEHMYDPWGVLLRLKTYLTADAQILASIPNARNLWLLNELAHGRFPYGPVGLLDITHIRFFTRAEIEKLFQETGYAIEDWARTQDPRLLGLEMPAGASSVGTDKLVLKDVAPEEFQDLKCLQFIVRAQPADAVGTPNPADMTQRDVRLRRLAVYARDYSISACPQIRFLRPARRLWGVLECLWGTEEAADGSFRPKRVEADAYVVTRLYPSQDTQASIEALFATGKPVIYDTDDLLIDLPADNLHAAEYAPYAPYIEALLRRAHAVTVSTPALAERMRTYNPNVHVVPNHIDFDLFHRLPKPPRREVRIGLVGTAARGGDFELVDAALRRICEEYPRRVRIAFIGALPEGWKGHPCAEHEPFLPDYRAYAARMKALDLDIGLAPLRETPFNDCKSAIKWMEYSALGMASIVSHVPAYRDVVRQGETGLLVDNRPEKWYTALKLLIDEPEYRQLLALQAQRQVLREHALQRQGQRYYEAYQALYRNLLARTPEAAQDEPAPELEDPRYTLWLLGHALQAVDRKWIEQCMAGWTRRPRFALGLILPADKGEFLSDTLSSLASQLLPEWECYVVSEGARPEQVMDWPQLRWLEAKDTDWLPTLNACLIDSGADWVGLLEAGDRLPEQALFRLAEKGLRHPEWQVLYSDEDRLDARGERHSPYFKKPFDIDWLRSAPFTLGGGVWCRREAFARLGGYRGESLGFEHWDLVLRAVSEGGEGVVGHLADVLYHRHEAGGHCRRPAEAVQVAARQALEAHLARMNLEAKVEEGPLPGSFHIRYAIEGEPLVSILLPTRNRLDLLKPCLTSLIEITGYTHCEVLVIDNGSDEPETLDYLRALEDLGSPHLRVLRKPGPFNYAAPINAAAAEAKGEYLLLLNNDTQVIHPEWLEEMLGLAQRPEVGAVGAKLFREDGLVQHAGVLLGMGAAAGHIMGMAADDPGHFGQAVLPQAMSAVTAACLLTRKRDYLVVGGMDAERFPIDYNDVDYCLKLAERGLKVLWTPHARLIHLAGASRRGNPSVSVDLQRAGLEFIVKWAGRQYPDRHYNRNLSLQAAFMPEITPPLTWDPEWRPAPRVVAIHADEQGCGEYRIRAPMRALQSAGEVMGWDVGHYFTPADWLRLDPDAIVFQRQITPDQVEIMQGIARYCRAYRVFELDDLITNIPVSSSQKALFTREKDLIKRFRKAVGLCHRFVVSTDYLAEAFRGFHDDIRVAPNYLEGARWLGFTPKRRVGGKPRVGWAGSVTHAGDLRLIEQLVRDTAAEVDWVFLGMCPESIRPAVAEFHEPVALADYPAKLASLNLDLAVAPLEDVPFNHGKSHLRLLEYGVMGYPVICTDITPYRGDYPVWRVANRYRDWLSVLRAALSDMEALAQAGDTLRRYVLAHWILEDHLEVWRRAWLP